MKNLTATYHIRIAQLNDLARVQSCARSAGFETVELYTNEKMSENLVMYPKLGYKEIERKQQDGFNRVFFRKYV